MDALGLTEVSMVGEGFLGSNLCTWTAIKRPNQVCAAFSLLFASHTPSTGQGALPCLARLS